MHSPFHIAGSAVPETGEQAGTRQLEHQPGGSSLECDLQRALIDRNHLGGCLEAACVDRDSFQGQLETALANYLT